MNLRRRLMGNSTDTPDVLYLYKEGDECVDVTGGWYTPETRLWAGGSTPYEIINSRDTNTTVITEKRTDHLHISIQSTSQNVIACQFFSTTKPIKTKSYSHLSITCKITTAASTKRVQATLDDVVDGRTVVSHAGYTTVKYFLNNLIVTSTAIQTVSQAFSTDENLKVALGRATYTSASTGNTTIEIYKVWLSK